MEELVRDSFIEQCKQASKEARLKLLREKNGYDEEYFKGDQDKKDLLKQTEVMREDTLNQRKEEM
jgi:hypothetical protein